MYGWTMLCKWGHPVATLPVTDGIIRHTRRMTEFCESSASKPPARCAGSCHHRPLARHDYSWHSSQSLLTPYIPPVALTFDALVEAASGADKCAD
eukprot:3577042-Pleurochrysis_carterae.AAC.1